MMPRLTRWTGLAIAMAWALAGANPAAATTKEVVVLTSFSKELFEAYKQAFEQRQPGVKMIVEQQQTNAGVTYIRETRAKPEADVFWVSAVDAFQTLKAEGLLDRPPISKELLARIPARIGGFPLHDPDGHGLRGAAGRARRRQGDQRGLQEQARRQVAARDGVGCLGQGRLRQGAGAGGPGRPGAIAAGGGVMGKEELPCRA